MEPATTLETMRRGGTVFLPDPEVNALEVHAGALLQALNATPMSDMARRIDLLRQALIGYEPGLLCSPVAWQFGHLAIGRNCFINRECLFIDNATITLEPDVAIGPRVQFLTATHPLRDTERLRFDAEGRRVPGAVLISAPIVVAEKAWIGAGVIVMPGVTIGARSVIGAGSVVTKSVPPDSLAYGNPCRVVRRIE